MWSRSHDRRPPTIDRPRVVTRSGRMATTYELLSGSALRGTPFAVWRCESIYPTARDANGRTTNPPTLDLVRRHRTPLGQKSHALAQARSPGLRHPFPPHGPRRHPVRHGIDA